MIGATVLSLTEMFSPPFRRLLLLSMGLALLLVVLAGIGLHTVLSSLAALLAAWGEATAGGHAAWQFMAWLLSIAAALGIVTGALFLMPAVTAFAGSFFVDDIGDAIERRHYPNDPPGRALPLSLALAEGIKTALVSVAVYLVAAPFLLVGGLGVVIIFFATAYLLSREYFLLAAMRFRPPGEAKAMRRANRASVFAAGLPIALFVSIPILNLATPLFAMAMMVHIHKQLSGRRVEIVEPRRV